MKITAFNGSPRAERSNTNVIVEKFLEGAKSAGAEIDNVFLIKQNITHCSGCFSCWFKTPGRCIYNDDMKDLLEKYKSSDIICFATPVYTWNMTATLKNFIDRLIPLRCPVVTQAGGKFDMKKRIKKFPDAVVVSNCGFQGDRNFDTIKEIFKTCNPILEIYRNSGMLLNNKRPEIKSTVDEYLQFVKKAGFEIVNSGGKVSDHIKTKLDMELIDPEEYVKILSTK